jgi:hypothetical protein
MSAPAATVPPTWQIATAALFSQRSRALVQRLLPLLPVASVLLLQLALTLRLNNIANADEALYIGAGHHYLIQWSGGPAAPTAYYGGFFSGFPMAYPVLAGALDSLGGLELARDASLLMMLGANYCVGAVAAHLAGPVRGRQVRLASMLLFALTGSVLFVGHFATYDAACMSAVSAAAALAIVKSSYWSAALAGAAGAVAGICKYSAAPFLPVIVVLALLSHDSLRRSTGRAIAAAATGIAGLLAVYLPAAPWVTKGIEFTTASRVAENARSVEFLIEEFGRGVGLLLALTVIGAAVHVRSSRRSRRQLLLVPAMLAAGFALPLSQMRLHEYTSFDKHLTFAAIFFAPLAGQVLGRRIVLASGVAAAVAVYLLAVFSLERSEFISTEWPDSTPVMNAIHAGHQPGTYMGVGATTMGYYSSSYKGMAWEEPYAVFGAGKAAIRSAVEENRYAGIFFTSGTTASAELDSNTSYLADLLRHDPDYQLVGSWPKHKYDLNRFFLYMRRPGVAPSPS